jgi:truncated hemoglobin YjbI/uncharacterized Fe-S cluster protein YjdI/CDGSH-type Zn-finger protein
MSPSTRTEAGAGRLLAEARSLAATADPPVARRLERSVVRPLEHLAGEPDGTSTPRRGSVETRLFTLARLATRLRVAPGAPAEVLEATAALHDLVGTLLPERLPELARRMRTLPPSILVAPDGPLARRAPPRAPAARTLPLRRVEAEAALRRHARRDRFPDAKDPNRVADRRDSYPGMQVTVLDNRGTCAHSGFCTDRLPTVFHSNGNPAFVTPSGGRMDEIVRAVRACPSGALSFAVDGVEARDQVDLARDPAIEVSKDGPYRITGWMPLLDERGAPVARNEGASFEHFSLCRCGKSQNKPFCSGIHWYANFHDPPPVTGREPTLFEWAGGYPALLRMTRIFYGKYVPEDPLLSPLFANMSPDHPERVASWLSEVFEGPKLYSERYGGYELMISRHLNKALREEQRARWVELLSRSAEDAGLPADAEFRAAFVAYLEWGSRIAKENSTPGAVPPPHMPVPRWWWVCNAYPDARRSALDALAKPEQVTVSLPGPDEMVSFEQHIKPLFRDGDRRSMKFAFDLWDHDDVAKNGDAILERLQEGSMPCDGAWPAERIAVFERWVEAGTPA